MTVVHVELVTPVLKLGPLDPIRIASGKSLIDLLAPVSSSPMYTDVWDDGVVQLYPCELKEQLTIPLGMFGTIAFRPVSEDVVEFCVPHGIGQKATDAVRASLAGTPRTERAPTRGWWAVIPVRLRAGVTVTVPLGPVLGHFGLRRPACSKGPS